MQNICYSVIPLFYFTEIYKGSIVAGETANFVSPIKPLKGRAIGEISEVFETIIDK